MFHFVVQIGQEEMLFKLYKLPSIFHLFFYYERSCILGDWLKLIFIVHQIQYFFIQMVFESFGNTSKTAISDIKPCRAIIIIIIKQILHSKYNGTI